MTLTVREMTGSEVDIIIDYFQKSTPEHLEILGVDPTRLPNPGKLAGAPSPRMRTANRSTNHGAGHLAVERPADRLFDV
ncbi:hypothetical protein [Bradyrhizobium sp. URHD0069]|uniref:hypothetical protein n=1 Tax=Bradyrhizobium sp. URHD0069 TaxID=1380355 RepID=UPI001FD88351|nr:hypothetical protein [Bradyrhizobium sp. URHD0069]